MRTEDAELEWQKKLAGLIEECRGLDANFREAVQSAIGSHGYGVPVGHELRELVLTLRRIARQEAKSLSSLDGAWKRALGTGPTRTPWQHASEEFFDRYRSLSSE